MGASGTHTDTDEATASLLVSSNMVCIPGTEEASANLVHNVQKT